ncbi:MAG TPA: HNH endonuclease [Ilumatobacter sp.]
MTSPDPTVVLQRLRGADIGAADSSACRSLLDDVRRLRGWVDAVDTRITARLVVLHDTAGAAPAADVQTRCGGVSAAEGKRKERRATVIDAAPSFGDALAHGSIGAEHVDALANATAGLAADVRDQLFDMHAALLADARRSSPERFGRGVRDLARRLERDHGLERNHRQRRDTFLARKLNAASGLIEGRFAFHPELASQVFGPIDREVAAMITEGAQAGVPDCVDRSVDRNRLAAEALGRLVSGGHQQRRPAEAEITVIVDRRTLATGELHDRSVCETSCGAELPPASITRLLCQGRVVPIIVDRAGNAVDAGRTIRHANRTQRRALRAMYRSCAFAGCDIAFDRCEVHHIEPWESGGPTDLGNLIPICSRHHHLVHDHAWVLDLAPDRTLTMRQPDGTTFAVSRPDVPPQRRRTDHERRRRTAA